MAVVWAVSLRIQNAGIVDIAWAAGFTPVIGIYAVFSAGYVPRLEIGVAMVTIWSLRLAAHLYSRVMALHPVEDGRYQELRKRWADGYAFKMFWFFQAQSLLVWILSAPFLLVFRNSAPGLSAVECLGALLWAIALIGEWVADRQLAAFKSDPALREGICRTGLWKYSRHPNYFFEWLVWCAYFVFAIGSPHGGVAVYCPLLMLYFLFKITGIPLTEEQAIRTRGEAYRQYQKTTSVFVPWFPKKI